ncbi:inner membrane transporter RhtA [Prauserella shujinwangii]|uniref:Inner membrane transporter RhtA n=1 Tax=Prauserella shujinwangii TaxID=1453103 RepID=A0A2T0LV47_9PSEU|nr:EamA family transporter [Prauserella shujinwangii]PRX47723.1 inner membrane transporter RhtA [Prauserella shujinwangii]
MAPWALVLGSVVSVQVGQAAGKQLAGQAGAFGVAALRLALAAIVLTAVHRPRLPRHRAEWLTVAGLGGAIAGMNLIYPALSRLPLGVAATLQLLGPVTLSLLSARRILDVVPALLAGVGIWSFHGTAGAEPLGTVLALTSGAAMAMYLVLSRRAGSTDTTPAPLALAVAVAASVHMPLGIATAGTALLRPEVLALAAFVAVLSAIVPYSLDFAALRRLPPRVVGVLESLEPAVAGLAGAALLAEFLPPRQWFAIGCVCAASAIAVRSGGQGGPEPGRH